MTTPVNSLGALEAAFRESLTRYHHELSGSGRRVSAVQNDLVADLMAAAESFAYVLPSRPHRLPVLPDTRYVAEQVRRQADKADKPTDEQVTARRQRLFEGDPDRRYRRSTIAVAAEGEHAA